MQVVVVGHGRTPEGREWGDMINAADVVVRMWDWAWQEPRDYGTKYDIGLIEAHPSYLREFYAHNHASPDEYWIASIVQPGRSDWTAELPENTEVFDQLAWVSVGLAMGGCGKTGRLRYTRGTLAALWAIENLGPKELVLVGFDSVHLGYAQPTPEAFSDAYRNNPGTFTFKPYTEQVSADGTTTKHGNHDYAIERPVMEHFANASRTNLVFAQDAW